MTFICCGADPPVHADCCIYGRSDLKPQAILNLQETYGDTNPKDAIGKAKVDMSLVSSIAIAHEAHAMMDGAKKYNSYNWRDKKVSARVYIAAALRHMADWYNREDVAADSGAHHLGHARACLGIILDALETGNLIDDRPIAAPVAKVLERLNQSILEKGLHLPKESS